MQEDKILAKFEDHDKQLSEQKSMLDILIEKSATKDDIKNVHGELKDIRGELKEVRSDIKDIRGELKEVRSDITDLKTAVDLLTVTANTTLQELRAANSNSKVHTNKNLEQDDRLEKCEKNIVQIKEKLQMAI